MLYKRKEAMDQKVKLIQYSLSVCIVTIGAVICISDRIAGFSASQADDPACHRYNYLLAISKIIGCIFLVLFIIFVLSISKILIALHIKFKKID